LSAPVVGASLLSDAHYTVLTDDSGIAPEIIEARGYRTLGMEDIAELVSQGKVHAGVMQQGPWMGIPVLRPDGTKHCDLIRLDTPPRKAKGSLKYRWPSDTRNALDVHPFSRSVVRDSSVPLIVTEGIKKGDAILSHATHDYSVPPDYCVLSLNGCYGWKSSTDTTESVASLDWHDVGLADRHCYLVADSDYLTNENVRKGWDECARYLASKAGDSRVSIVVVPPTGPKKQGADDYLLTHTLDELLSYARSPEQVVATARPVLHLVSMWDLIASAPPELPHLVTRIVPENTISVLAGHTGSHKTWHAVLMAADLAAGNSSYVGHPELSIPKKVASIYLNGEMSDMQMQDRMSKAGLSPRFKGIDATQVETVHVPSNDPEMTSFTGVNLMDDTYCRALENSIADMNARLVFIDSLSMCWLGGDENSAMDVGALYQRLRQIIRATDCGFVIIHHLKKPGDGRPSSIFQVRGSGQIIQQADNAFVLEVMKQEGPVKLVRFAQEKSRSSIDLPAFLTRVEDHDGMYTTIEYFEDETTLRQREFVESSALTRRIKLGEWIQTELIKHPALQKEGLRRPTILNLLVQSWKDDTQPFPSESSVVRALDWLVKTEFLVEEPNRRLGNLYRLNIPPQETP
jgi:hypothetical protein